MKKTLSVLAVLSLLFIQKTDAQLNRGTAIVGADLANFNLGLKKGAQTTIDITPMAMWMLSNNIAIGGYVNFDLTTQKVEGTTYTSTGYGIGAMGRYYVNDPKMNLLRSGRWFFEANAGFEGSNVKGGNSTNGLGLGIGPGYAYFLTPNIALETLLKFDENLGFGNTTSTTDLDLRVGFQIYLPGRATVNSVKSKEGM